MVALLIVDIQEDYFGKNAKINFQDQSGSQNTGTHQKVFQTPEEYIASVNTIIKRETAAESEIIYIREELPDTFFFRKVFGHSLKGTAGVKCHHALVIAEGQEFTKMFGSAFSNQKFTKYLKSKGISEVHIVGCDSAKCAFLTAKDAAKKGYTVKMISDGLFSFFPQLTGKCEKELSALGVKYV